MKRLTIIAALALAFVVPQLYAQNTSSIGGELNGLKATSKQYHVTANTTINVATSTCKLYGVAIATSNAGTTWTLTVAAVSAGANSAAANFVNALTFATTQNPQIIGGTPITGFVMQGGINLTFTGTPGVADIWVVYK